MKTIVRLLSMVILMVSIIYYFEIDVKTIFNEMLSGKSKQTVIKTSPSPSAPKENSGITNIPKSEGIGAKTEDSTYDEIIKFIAKQKEGKKLVESYRVLDKNTGGNLKERSYIADNGLSVIVLINNDDAENRNVAEDILKNISVIQNKDGSWYDFYDTSGEIVKISGKDYTVCDTGNNSLLLYAYSYYTNMTGDGQFKEVMQKSADFIISRTGGKTEGVYDINVSQKGIRSVRANAYAYFGLREYALSCMESEYNQFKEKLKAADNIASWTLNSCIEKGMFIEGYSGKDKITGIDLDSQIMGAMLLKSINPGDKIKYGAEDFNAGLLKLSKNVGGIDGYRIDDSAKIKNIIWCEGTYKAAVALNKMGQSEKSKALLNSIKNIHSTISKNLSPRGIPYSTNIDNKIDVTNLESVSSSAWAAIALKCDMDAEISNVFFGEEEVVFKKYK